MSDQRPPVDQPWLEHHRRPAGVTDETVEALGKLSEALEWVERARGRLYDFHQLTGRADMLFGDAADLLREAGHDEVASELEEAYIGRNVLEGRWTFQIVEEYDATYWAPISRFEAMCRENLIAGRRHVFESEMKEARRTLGRRHHEGRPDPGQ